MTRESSTRARNLMHLETRGKVPHKSNTHSLRCSHHGIPGERTVTITVAADLADRLQLKMFLLNIYFLLGAKSYNCSNDMYVILFCDITTGLISISKNIITYIDLLYTFSIPVKLIKRFFN